jgi:hypothetical protein
VRGFNQMTLERNLSYTTRGVKSAPDSLHQQREPEVILPEYGAGTKKSQFRCQKWV